ncbi:membrane protein [Roseivivax halodurans JCM 10272]|uniref:Membrane protein n=1 Tax=Roseivivax halodurans JCM 10272 TaxID=1449350 RepID=X7EKF7_9RHOB|nr:SIMPL domain-containing protein [Roseivivax halodurans]ETX15666.1 membrane protein [Roseivivax halodurans JCM 10272]
MQRIVIVLALALGLAGGAAAQEEGPRLTVRGEGEASAPPDMAVITLGVTERASEAAAAMDAASGVAARILERLETLGVEARDVQTSDLSLNPVRRGDGSEAEPEIVAYEASNRVDLRVRDLGSLSDVLAAVLEDGANTLGGLSFSVSDPEPLLNEARRDAVAKARSKAELYAEAAGVTLGPIVRIDEGGSGGGFPRPMAEMRAVKDVPVAAGETGYTAEVTIVYELVD